MSLSDSDLKKIQDLLKVTIAEDDTLVRKADIAHLPTKDEYYEQTLKVLKKLDDMEEANEIVVARQTEHSDQIEALQKIHPRGVHPTLS